MATGARRPSLARIGAGPEPIKALLVEGRERQPRQTRLETGPQELR